MIGELESRPRQGRHDLRTIIEQHDADFSDQAVIGEQTKNRLKVDKSRMQLYAFCQFIPKSNISYQIRSPFKATRNRSRRKSAKGITIKKWDVPTMIWFQCLIRIYFLFWSMLGKFSPRRSSRPGFPTVLSIILMPHVGIMLDMRGTPQKLVPFSRKKFKSFLIKNCYALQRSLSRSSSRMILLRLILHNIRLFNHFHLWSFLFVKHYSLVKLFCFQMIIIIKWICMFWINPFVFTHILFNKIKTFI